ncbi:MAG: cyclic pyranopterin monophosphate synthase MoaC [SAR324 cluster bacterium]|nr:cyclic pyranopterin monophosphate synthase MoaC [SAR324 cluster bacterium]
MSEFTHLSHDDLPRMVDVSHKSPTERRAVAISKVKLGTELARRLEETGSTKKGPVFQTAVVAGIQAAKKTSELIPMCHPVPLSSVKINISLENETALIEATAKTTSSTGVEMEALTAASVAALTLYDMCKSISKSMVIESTYLLEKTGGKSGDFQHPLHKKQQL